MVKWSHLVTPKRLQQYGLWAPSVLTYVAAGFVGMVYFTDWKVIVKKIPFYNAKFKD